MYLNLIRFYFNALYALYRKKYPTYYLNFFEHVTQNTGIVNLELKSLFQVLHALKSKAGLVLKCNLSSFISHLAIPHCF